MTSCLQADLGGDAAVAEPPQEDDPDAFVFEPSSGVLPGIAKRPTIPATQVFFKSDCETARV